MTSRPILVVAALCLASALAAQSVGATLRTPTGLQASARSGTILDTQVLPAGPLPANGLFEAFSLAGGPISDALLEWQLTSSPVAVELVLSHRLAIDAGVTGALGESSTGPNDFVLDVVATAAGLPAVVTVQMLRAATPGFPAPLCEIDVGDDGIVESSGAFPGVTSVPVTLGTTTVPVRIRVGGQYAAVQGNHVATDSVRVSVTPQNYLSILPGAYGCATANAFLQPAFAQSGVLFGVGTPGLAVAVFGLGVQPLLLPNVGSPLPCLLLPSPDLVVLIPPTGQLLGIPTAARPITIHVQGVLLLPTGLGTSNGFVVQG